jgi:glycosyltransferase involved in cell wall biosynthesis
MRSILEMGNLSEVDELRMNRSGSAGEESPSLSPVKHWYLLLVSIPCHVDENGSLWLERGWHRDFQAHLRYLQRLMFAAPRCEREEISDAIRVEVPEGTVLRVIELPRQDGMAGALRALPQTAALLWRAIGDAAIVHSGVVGWPYPLGWLANPMAVLRRKKLVIVVESATWRLTGSADDNWKRRLRARISEAIARWSVNHADLSLFTHPGYRDTLMRNGAGAAEIAPASWINGEDLLSNAAAAHAWELKRGGSVKLLFAGRLTADKGVDLLLQALRLLDERGAAINLDIVGDGALLETCRHFVRQHMGAVSVRVLDLVPYGPAFFELVRGYHAVVIPSMSDEQPRVIFDAYAQAVPVIASDTDGLRPHVLPDETGWIVPRGNATALANALALAAGSGAGLERMGLNALENARSSTHQAMHERRWRLLVKQFGAG